MIKKETPGSQLQNNSIACHDMEKTSEIFILKFQALKSYKKEQKMQVVSASKYDNEELPIRLEVDKTPAIFQPLTRWYNGQGRILVIEFLEKEIKEYSIFFKWVIHIQNSMVSLLYSDANQKKINRVINENQTFLTTLLLGLDELILHYNGDDVIVTRLKDVHSVFTSLVNRTI
jgi:hypothetical protein